MTPLAWTKPLTQTTADRVVGLLRSWMHQGRLNPGDRLPPERELAKLLGVGRVTVREALKVLSSLGYLEIRRGAAGGAFVTPLESAYEHWLTHMRANKRDFQDLIGYRIAIETKVAELAARNYQTPWVDELRSIAGQMDVHRTRAEFRRADSTFHEALARASANQRLVEAVSEARGELFFAIDQLAFDNDIDASSCEHANILAAVLDGDAKSASGAMQRHIERTAQILGEILGIDLSALPDPPG